jgi:uncharacterized membrane protein
VPSLLLLVGLGVVTAYVVSLVGPAPKPVPLSPQALAQLNAATAASQQAAQQALQAQQTLSALQSGQLFEPGFQGQPGSTVSGVLVWRGEVAADGARIVYDASGTPHREYQGF